jgi:hypothetical protein
MSWIESFTIDTNHIYMIGLDKNRNIWTANSLTEKHISFLPHHRTSIVIFNYNIDKFEGFFETGWIAHRVGDEFWQYLMDLTPGEFTPEELKNKLDDLKMEESL